MKKPKRVSLAVKVNIVIMAMVLSVSVLLTLISENAYQKAVFMPYFRKLENTEILVEELKPFLQEFLPYLGSEELNQVISEGEREGNDGSYYFWLLKEPGMKEPPFSLYDDWMEFEITLYGIRGNADLYEISCIAEKDGVL